MPSTSDESDGWMVCSTGNDEFLFQFEQKTGPQFPGSLFLII